MTKSTRFFALANGLSLALILAACDEPGVKPDNTPSSAPAARVAAPETREAAAKGAAFEKPADLKERLTPLQYQVTQENGTEPPFQNEFWDNKKAGIYVDIVSGEPLFSSKDKFKSGTGWPSFTRPLIAGNVVEKVDETHGMLRTEVRSKTGDSHLGHVFPDGPKPSGMRYCINSASLRFIKANELAKEGYGQFVGLFSEVEQVKPSRETAILAAGCFWCTEAIFEAQPGVIEVISGYTGGEKVDPTYKEVCTGLTGHTEAIKVVFDPSKTEYRTLVDLFWRTFDPTDGRGVEPDFGNQYRHEIFYLSDAQKAAAEASMAAYQKTLDDPIKTKITAASKFYEAEEYHQDFVKKNPRHGYVVNVSYPRMERVGVEHP